VGSELESVRSILKRRDGLTDTEVDEMFEIFRDDLAETGAEEAEDLLAEHFGLKPDYLYDAELKVWG
jgi:hypothetical protein